MTYHRKTGSSSWADTGLIHVKGAGGWQSPREILRKSGSSTWTRIGGPFVQAFTPLNSGVILNFLLNPPGGVSIDFDRHGYVRTFNYSNGGAWTERSSAPWMVFPQTNMGALYSVVATLNPSSPQNADFLTLNPGLGMPLTLGTTRAWSVEVPSGWNEADIQVWLDFEIYETDVPVNQISVAGNVLHVDNWDA